MPSQNPLQADYSITTIDLPAWTADSSLVESMFTLLINDQGEIAGTVSLYTPQVGLPPHTGTERPLPVGEAMFLDDQGNITETSEQPNGVVDLFNLIHSTAPFSPPDVTMNGVSYQSAIAGVSESGSYAVGDYSLPDGVSTKLFVDHDGQVTNLLFNGVDFTDTIPSIIPPGWVYYTPRAVNDQGVVVGAVDEGGISETDVKAFIDTSGTLTTFSVPGGTDPEPSGITDSGEIVGTYNFSSDSTRGFIYWQGQVQTFEVPGAIDTTITGINNQGQIVGRYEDSSGETHGYVASPLSDSTVAETGDFLVSDQTTNNVVIALAGTTYDGPVGGQSNIGPAQGLTSQFIFPTTDQVTVSSTQPDVFIQLGMEGQANPTIAGINVSAGNGNNVLDSYANSSFLTDGSGIDQNYVDARALTENMWSTVVNFHLGDNVTIWGVTPQDFSLQWIGDTQGATGYTGLTGVFVPTASSQPEVAITIAGFTKADLTDGKLSISYNTGNGTPYASIHST